MDDDPDDDPENPGKAEPQWPPAPDGLRQEDATTPKPSPSIVALALAAIGGYVIVAVGTWFFCFGPILVVLLYRTYRKRYAVFAWAFAIGGAVSFAEYAYVVFKR